MVLHPRHSSSCALSTVPRRSTSRSPLALTRLVALVLRAPQDATWFGASVIRHFALVVAQHFLALPSIGIAMAHLRLVRMRSPTTQQTPVQTLRTGLMLRMTGNCQHPTISLPNKKKMNPDIHKYWVQGKTIFLIIINCYYTTRSLD